MIISASRRTDIPAFYGEWFINRIRDGFVYVRNPMNPKQISKITLTRETVDFIIFWTKDPTPFLPYLDELVSFPFYFLYTLTGYGADLEQNISSMDARISTFEKLAHKIGPQKIVWRYDPILISSKYNKDYHSRNFERLANVLKGLTENCIISFVDIDCYIKCRRNLKETGVREPDVSERVVIAQELSKIACKNKIKISTCAEELDYSDLKIEKGSCIDASLIERITRKKVKIRKDKGQRKDCLCIESIDIGAYNTCMHQCLYCYANVNQKQVLQNNTHHNPKSTLLFGELKGNEKIVPRKPYSIF